VDVTDIAVPETTLQGTNVTPSVAVSNPTSETQEFAATLTFGSQEEQINEALLADETRGIDVTFSTDDLSAGTHEVSIQYSGTTTSRELTLSAVEGDGIHGLLGTESDAEVGNWTLLAQARKQDTSYFARAQFSSDTQQFQIDHPEEFDSDEQVTLPYDVDLVFQKSASGAPAFNNVPYAYTLAEQTSIETDVAVVGSYELPTAYRVEIQVLDGSGNPVENSEHVGIRLPNGSGFGFQTDANGYLKQFGRDETGVELVGDVTIEYRVNGDFEKRTKKDVTVTEEQEFTLTVEDL
jgi:hypothetical protein